MTAHLVTVVQTTGLHHQLIARVPALLASTVRSCLLSTIDGPVDDEQAADVETLTTALLRRLVTTAGVVDVWSENLGVTTSIVPVDQLPAGVPHGDDDAMLAILLRRVLGELATEVEVNAPRGGPRTLTIGHAHVWMTAGEMAAVMRAITYGAGRDTDPPAGAPSTDTISREA